MNRNSMAVVRCLGVAFKDCLFSLIFPKKEILHLDFSQGRKQHPVAAEHLRPVVVVAAEHISALQPSLSRLWTPGRGGNDTEEEMILRRRNMIERKEGGTLSREKGT